MKKSLLLFAFFLRFYYSQSQGEIPVNMYTGTPSISIPIASISSQDIADNIFLTYNAKGVSVKAPNGFYGIGWNLQGGGKITREVRGLPDDYNTSTKHGWLHNQMNTSTGSFGNTSDLSNATCTDELNDFNKINSWNYLVDTEPDLFQYSIPGHSGSFVFDNSPTPVIKLIPFDDIKVQPQFNASNKIESFAITTNDGTLYSFNITSEESLKTVKSSAAPANIEFLKTEYEQYKSTIFYNHEWVLNQITSPSGAFLKYTYSNESYPNKTDYQPDHTILVSIKNNTPSGYMGILLFSREVGTNTKKLATVESSSSEKIEFLYTDDPNDPDAKSMLSEVKIYDYRRSGINQLVKELILEYNTIGCTLNCEPPPINDDPGYIDYSDYKRKFLSSIWQLSQCDKLRLYDFSYKDPDLLPMPNSLSMDSWGYFNGKNNVSRVPTIYVYPQLAPSERYRFFPIANYSGEKYIMEGADLSVNPNTVQAGVLDYISYGSGARTIFTYEPNEFYDAVANETYYGGGLRIKSITTEDGVNPNGTITKNFEYKDNTGKSSGRILYKPSYTIPLYQYADPAPNSTYVADYNALVLSGKNPWLYLTARVDVDLSQSSYTHGSVVGYEKVTVRNPGSGYVKFEYHMPGAWGNGPVDEWIPSISKFARSSACPAMDFITSGSEWFFPFTRNPEYDYARGRLSKKYEYSEQNALVRETTVTYQNLFSNNAASEKVWGVNYHKMPNTGNVFLFSKYFLLTNATKVTSIENVITYDAAASAKKLSEDAQFFYESPYNRLLTKIRKTESDGTAYLTYRKYPLDYGTVPAGADKPSEMIGKLQTTFRNGMPIEVYSSVIRSGQPEKFISGSIVKFNDFGSASVLPQYHLQLTGTPLATYAPASINPSTKVFDIDPHYETVLTTLAYSDFEKPLNTVGMSRIPHATSWGYENSLPVCEIAGAAHDQYAFSDFETGSGNRFIIADVIVIAGNRTIEAPPTHGIGRAGSYGVPPNLKLVSKTLYKGAVSYIFSGWIKRTDVVTSLTLNIKNTSGASYYQQTYNFNPSSGEYSYFEYEIPIDAALSQFIVEIQGSFAATSNTPALDDVAFYPSHADLKSYTYTPPYGISSITQRDQTIYQAYGSHGRVKDILDRNGNIIEHYDYFFPEETSTAVLKAFFTSPNPVSLNEAVRFDADQNCMDNVSYEWNFGSGFQPGTRVQSHTFTTAGDKVVTLKVTHPYYGTQTYSRTIEVDPGVILD